jgi:hypothetical protein
VEANPGDWGLDVVVGDIDDLLSVWQAKFFIDGVGDVQKGQIRESFGRVTAKAKKKGSRSTSGRSASPSIWIPTRWCGGPGGSGDRRGSTLFGSSYGTAPPWKRSFSRPTPPASGPGSFPASRRRAPRRRQCYGEARLYP